MARTLTDEDIAIDAKLLKWETPAEHARMKSHAPHIAVRYHGEVVRLRAAAAAAETREAKLRELRESLRLGYRKPEWYGKQLESILNDKGEANAS